ncbi:MAG TPA: TetR family transcriptional regulator [Rhizomicrobium sp.]|jgi:AcrR family transcriptional regulator
MARRKLISDEAVLDAALQVMFRKGPSEFALTDVAAAAGIAPATLLQRFGDKRRLIVAAIARDNESFARTLSELPRVTGADAVIAVFRVLMTDTDNADAFADQLLWLHQDMRDPDLNALARERFRLLREAVAVRLPPLPIAPAQAALLIEAQWQGALLQWGVARQGRLIPFVTKALTAWFALVLAPRLSRATRSSSSQSAKRR